MVTALIVAAFALALVVLSLPGLHKDRRQPVTVPEPERIATVTPYVITDAPYREERPAFAYDNGLAVEETGNS